ncbi:MAG: hypothetical protein GY812_07270 [Actinomycetia bacterium]|nr:hypothetical protein [Actinomycetes bacterium]
MQPSEAPPRPLPLRVVAVTCGVGALLLGVLALRSLGDDGTGSSTAAAAADEAASTTQPPDCYSALVHFSGDEETARAIVWRESRNQPDAQNARSSAAGCFQIVRVHDWRFDAVGCSWQQRYEAVCNTKAADHLYRAESWEPWDT